MPTMGGGGGGRVGGTQEGFIWKAPHRSPNPYPFYPDDIFPFLSILQLAKSLRPLSIYLQPEKGSPFGWSLLVESFMGSIPPPPHHLPERNFVVFKIVSYDYCKLSFLRILLSKSASIEYRNNKKDLHETLLGFCFETLSTSHLWMGRKISPSNFRSGLLKYTIAL